MYVRSSFCRADSPMCVEVEFDGDEVRVRDSKDPGGPVLRFTREEWRLFVLGVILGEFHFDQEARR